jgi:hypothetical protein
VDYIFDWPAGVVPVPSLWFSFCFGYDNETSAVNVSINGRTAYSKQESIQ